MVAPSRALGLGLTLLLAACGGAPGPDRKAVEVEPSARGGTGGGAALHAPNAGTPVGAAEAPPLTEEELRRLLDALEQEIGQR